MNDESENRTDASFDGNPPQTQHSSMATMTTEKTADNVGKLTIDTRDDAAFELSMERGGSPDYRTEVRLVIRFATTSNDQTLLRVFYSPKLLW